MFLLKRRFALLIINIMICILVSGQDIIKGKIVNKSTHYPIPYTSILVQPSGSGISADSSGNFTITNTISNSKLYFSAIGYKDTIVEFAYFKKNVILLLNPISYIIPEINIYPEKLKRVRLGTPILTDYNGEIHSRVGSTYTNYFPNKSRRKGYLESFSLRIPSDTRWDCPFRIRIMGVDTTFKTIGIHLLPNDIEVKAKSSGWVTIDLSSYSIPIPENGFIVSIIIIDAGSSYYYQAFKQPGSFGYGIGISLTTRLQGVLPWGYIWTEKQFGIITPLNMSGKCFNYAVRATLRVL